NRRNIQMKTAKVASVVTIVLALFLCGMASSQTDPGLRGGAAGAGGALASVNANSTLLSFFNDGLDRLSEVDSVSGTIEAGSGLGPRFNSRSCAACHAQPAVDRTSPATSPQLADATHDGTRN